ncbi:MAG TPA: acyl-CoA dehydrogenase family protein [Gemmatimonadaceae bacterium]|nr:acyl-CoA dehydrogenase family protein [Gemmatimonadaceae bacterium]
MDSGTLDWPFFSDAHRELAATLDDWARREITDGITSSSSSVDAACRAVVRKLGAAGWLRYTVPAAYGGAHEKLDVRSLCIARETLARISGLADIAFAMQGLGAGPITLFGSDALKERYLRRVGAGEAIAAFAISEREAGSDIAAMQTTARLDGNNYVIDGEKTWISNGGIADFYVVFCRLESEKTPASRRKPKDPQMQEPSPEVRRARPEFIALVVGPGDSGFSIAERIETLAPHPLARIRFENCRVPADRVVGEPGKGLKVALATLDVFRSTVGAAALGFARRALDEALAHVSERKLFGQALRDFQLTQARIARMATSIDASALLVYRAAWARDNGAPRITREAAMAKMYATEAAQRVIDDALQLLGGRGVVAGHPVEQLYREIRSLRIYEGTTEVQQLVIASQVLDAYAKQETAGG